MTKSLLLFSILVSAIVAVIVGYAFSNFPKEGIRILAPEPTPVPTPLARYEIESLSQKAIPKGEIKIKETISEEENYISYVFEHTFDPTFETKEDKTVTGQINIPNENAKYPIVLMLRGYVDQSIYETGIGTRNGAAHFAEQGFITIAPDFLGYAGSSSEAGNIYETRFQTYTTAMSLINSFDSIEQFDKENVFLWAHSNGGQVALTLLAISEKEFPTTLWAPVTKPFPYSVLYYTDESADGGKYIRRELAKFEELYDVDRFSFAKYLERIKAPLQIHQGGADGAIPVEWSDNFVAKMRNLEQEVEYFKYPAADHNMRPDWDTVIARDINFFNSFLEN